MVFDEGPGCCILSEYAFPAPRSIKKGLSCRTFRNANPGPKSPPGPGSRPSLDDLRTLRDGPHAFLLQIARLYGDVVRYPVGPLAVYLVVHPDGVKHVLQDNAKNYSKDTFQYNLLSSITGRGLLTSDGDFWLRQRRLAQPAFHRQRIAGFAGLMTGYAEAMLVRWDGYAARGEPIDVAAEMMHLALQIVGKALFSIEIGSAADELAQATLVVLDHIVGRARTFGIVPQLAADARQPSLPESPGGPGGCGQRHDCSAASRSRRSVGPPRHVDVGPRPGKW